MQYTQSSEQCYTEGNTLNVTFLVCLALSFASGALFAWGTSSSKGGNISESNNPGDQSFQGTCPYVTHLCSWILPSKFKAPMSCVDKKGSLHRSLIGVGVANSVMLINVLHVLTLQQNKSSATLTCSCVTGPTVWIIRALT